MVLLSVIALVWLSVRVSLVLLAVLLAPESERATVVDVQDEPSPQDAPFHPQDSDPQLSRPVLETEAVHPTVLFAAAWWRWVTSADAQVSTGRSPAFEEKAGDRWRAALRATIADTVPRPGGGPACLGGREDDAYLRGWDDGVDWIADGHDAEVPTWGGVAYMTGWNDGVRDVARARRRAPSWPSPEASRTV